MKIEQYAALAAVSNPEQLMTLTELLELPCNAACPKCGSRDVLMTFVPFDVLDSVDVAQDESGFVVEQHGQHVRLEHFAHSCGTCGFTWTSRTPDTPRHAREFLDGKIDIGCRGREEFLAVVEWAKRYSPVVPEELQEYVDRLAADPTVESRGMIVSMPHDDWWPQKGDRYLIAGEWDRGFDYDRPVVPLAEVVDLLSRDELADD